MASTRGRIWFRTNSSKLARLIDGGGGGACRGSYQCLVLSPGGGGGACVQRKKGSIVFFDGVLNVSLNAAHRRGCHGDNPRGKLAVARTQPSVHAFVWTDAADHTHEEQRREVFCTKVMGSRGKGMLVCC